MAIGRISGPMLQTNLERQGVDLSIENDLLYVDVTNDRIGVKTASPTVELEVNGNIKADNLTANSITIGNSTVDSLDTGNIRLEGNTISTTNTDGNLILAPDGLGNISVNGTHINDLATPVADTDASTKGYVDSLFGNVSITGNAISTSEGNLLLDDDVDISGNLQVGDVVINGSLTGVDLQTGNITIFDNTIGSANTDGDINLVPNGNGNVSVPSNNVTLGQELSVTGNTSLSDVGIVGETTITGNIVQTGNTDLTGDLGITGNLTVTDSAQIENVSIDGSTVTTIATNSNLILEANGTGVISVPNNDVEIANSLSVSGNVNAVDITSTGVLDIGNIQVGNISLVDNTISSTNTDGNILLDPNGDGYVTLIGTNGFIPPIGTTSDRPSSPPAGLTRYNSSLELLEFWDGSIWRAAGPEAGTISAQTLDGDGSTTVFTLEKSSSTEAVIVSTNGTVQKPNTAYTVSGNQITFSEAPANGDTIDVRFITLTYSFDSINLSVYTRTEVLALADPSTGDIVYVTDGDSGNPCLSVYNGSTWKKVSFSGDL